MTNEIKKDIADLNTLKHSLTGRSMQRRGMAHIEVQSYQSSLEKVANSLEKNLTAQDNAHKKGFDKLKDEIAVLKGELNEARQQLEGKKKETTGSQPSGKKDKKPAESITIPVKK